MLFRSAAFRDAAPGVATSPGLATLVDWYAGADVAFAPTDVVMQVPPVYSGVEVLTPDVIERAHADGFEIWVWMDDAATQENAAYYTDLLGRAVDGLLVSKPALAVDVGRVTVNLVRENIPARVTAQPGSRTRPTPGP